MMDFASIPLKKAPSYVKYPKKSSVVYCFLKTHGRCNKASVMSKKLWLRALVEGCVKILIRCVYLDKIYRDLRVSEMQIELLCENL